MAVMRQSLPASEAEAEPVLRFAARPDAVRPEPPTLEAVDAEAVDDDELDEFDELGDGEDFEDFEDGDYEGSDYTPPAKLLAAGPSGVWAASDRTKLWVGQGTDGAVVTGKFAGGVDQVAVDARGRVWVVDGEERLHEVEAGAGKQVAKRRGEVPLDVVHAVAVESDWLLLLGERDDTYALVFSRDGERWFRASGPELGNMQTELVAGPGILQVMTGSEASCGGGSQSRYLARLDLARAPAPDPSGLVPLEWKPAGWDFDQPFDRHPGGGGWAFAHEPCDPDALADGVELPAADAELVDDDGWEQGEWEGLCAVDRKGEQQPVRGFVGAYLLEHGHGQTLLLEAGGLWSIEGDAREQLRLVRLGDGQAKLLEAGVEASVADGAGHLLVWAADGLRRGAPTAG